VVVVLVLLLLVLLRWKEEEEGGGTVRSLTVAASLRARTKSEEGEEAVARAVAQSLLSSSKE